MGRPKNKAKEAAVKAAAAASSPEELERIARRAGIKSRRTLEKWRAEAKAAEDDGGDETAAAADALPDGSTPEAARQAADAELVLGVLRFGVSFTTSSTAHVLGLDLQHPALKGIPTLAKDEEDLIRSVAPSLLPALGTMLEWIEKHGTAVFGVLFLGLVVPRVLLLGKAAKKIKELEGQLTELKKTKAASAAAPAAASAPAAAPPPPSSAPAAVPIAPGMATVRLLPREAIA